MPHHGGITVERADEYKYLGTVLDNRLGFNRNVDIHNNCYSPVFCLQKLMNIGTDAKILQVYY